MGNLNTSILYKEYIENDMNVSAICGATLGLAKHGALDYKAHTSNDKGFLKMICPEYKGEKLFKNKPAVMDRNLITASGVAPTEATHTVQRFLKLRLNLPCS